VGVGQLDDRQLPARGIVHAQSPCFCTVAPAQCYCMSNFTYVPQTSSAVETRPPHASVLPLARASRIHTGMNRVPVP